jgi:hypothetical protein
VKRGSSGAKIIIACDGVYKSGNRRTVQQGLWLITHRATALPQVLQMQPDGYKMEMLYQPPPWALDHTEVMLGMLRELESAVWSKPALATFDLDAVKARVEQLVAGGYIHDEPRRLTIQKLLLDAFRRIHWNDLRVCLTHGDTTFDNVMFRDDQLVMIDPIPTTTTIAVPDLWSSDIGHILRSTLGFEQARYGGEDQRFRVSPRQLRLSVIDDNEWLAASFWAVFHLLRTLPYQPDADARKRMEELTYDSAIRLL